jgi:hypothetical protein
VLELQPLVENKHSGRDWRVWFLEKSSPYQLVAETGQRPQMAASDQVEDGFIVHAQHIRDFTGAMNFYNVIHAFGRGGGAINRPRHRTRVFSAPSSRKLYLAEMHSPTIGEMAGPERRPSFGQLNFYGETLINSFRRGFLFI